jgi:molybdopterin molybdotransferase
VLTTAEALARILAATEVLAPESVDLASAAGRCLRQAVVAERDQPPFDRVMMDGIAIASADVAAGQREFLLQARQMAGEPAVTLARGNCIEIMTGAALPHDADCIVPVERISVTDAVATLETGYEPQARQFIHPRGSDYARGSTLLSPGRAITPMDIALIVAAGLGEVEVGRRPVVRVLSTGDELVAAGRPIAPHQVRLSNGPAMVAMLSAHGYDDCRDDHLPDDRDALARGISAHLESADVLVLSGGVSMGKADYVPDVLAELGVDVVFHKVSQRPGKPLWFGTAPGGKTVFALPGNPVSALVCCRHYVVPALDKASGLASPAPQFAALADEVTFEPDLTCFQPVRLISNAIGQLLAMPVRTNTSGDFAALSGTDGYVELPREQSRFATGSPVPLYRW